jgi:hypothetical protein
MVSIEITGNEVTVRILGHHRLWAVRNLIRFRMEDVESAVKVESSQKPPWRRCPGTYLPGFICAGTYHGEQGKEFWDTTFKGNAVEIRLKQGLFAKLVVDVKNPDELLKQLSSPRAVENG